MKYKYITGIATILCSGVAMSQTTVELADNVDKKQAIEKIIVEGTTAHDQPVATYGAVVSNLEYDPRVDLQSRNMAEAQADVSIRGGIFENTGFRIGSATLIDPQTGHYFSEIPIAPEMLTSANVLTGTSNALYGVNSSVGTLAYSWKPITDGVSVTAALGNNRLQVQRIHGAKRVDLGSDTPSALGIEGEYSRSESDGSIQYGDHQYERVSSRIQWSTDHRSTDVFLGYQNKFFGWPNMYTPYGVNETESIKTNLLMLNHQQQYGDNNTLEVSAYYRSNDDHYVFSRENPSIFEAFHKTTITALALSGYHDVNQWWGIEYSAQLSDDAIESTTLENNFTSRRYTTLSVLPQYQLALNNQQHLIVRLGASVDDTNRDDSYVGVMGDIRWQSSESHTLVDTVYLSYSQASQVVGYTAIGGSETHGLFRSNHDLKREVSKNIELGAHYEFSGWSIDSALFYRWDSDLVDWTYRFDSTSARTANPVDIDTLGLELLAMKQFDQIDLVASYTGLRKSEDYGVAAVDASFYALNYPDHRVTVGVVWRPLTALALRIDNEWRQQHENALRNGDDSALFTHLSLTYTPEQFKQLDITLAVDNLWDEAFEDIPGTPGRGDQYALAMTYRW